MEAVYVALIVAVAGFLGQWLLKRQEFTRQDQVAAQAAQAAQLLLERQDAAAKAAREVAAQAAKAAALLLDANERVAKQSATASEATQGQLRQIHTLVNANLTQAQQQELDATRAMYASMQEVVGLKRKLGAEPSPEALEALEVARARIVQLSRDVAHRIEQTEVGERQAAEGSHGDV